MPNYCGVYGCKSEAKKTPHLSFFSVPKDEPRRKIWIERMDRPDIREKDRHCVCSLHFTKEMFRNRRLKPDAVPTLNMPCETLIINSYSKKTMEAEIDKPTTTIIEMEQYQGASTSKASEKIQQAECGGDDQASDAELNSDDDISDEEVLPLKPQQKSKHKPDETVHDFGIKCSNCRGKITGFRYTCVQCVDVELCGACDARGAHADHYVLRIPGTRPKSEIAEVLTQVREALGMVLFSRKTPEINQPDEPEIIKPENIDEEAADPLKDDPNARPHKMNILEQALLGIPLIKEECIEPEQFDHTEKPFETPVIKQEVVDLGAEVIDTSAQTTATDLGNTITVYGHQPGSSSGSTSAKRPRVCPPQPAPAASSSGQVTTVTQDKKIASQPSSSSGSGFIVMSHAPRNTNTAPAKTSKGNKKKS